MTARLPYDDEVIKAVAAEILAGDAHLERIVDLHAGRGLPDPCPDGVPCCDGYAYLGPEHCMCWEPVYDLVQEPIPLLVEPAECATRDRMCADCAFRPGSPERTDNEHAVAGSDTLRTLVAGDGAFWCHDGLRKVVAMRHPNGLQVPYVETERGNVAHFAPRIVNGVPYRADGRPGLHCAGLAAARRAKGWTP